MLSSLATIALIVAVGYLVWGLFVRVRRQLLWRVRRKLILSYIFIGVVPALLIVGFCLIVVGILSMNISAYLFKDGYDEIVKNAGLLADAAAADIGRPSREPRESARASDHEQRQPRIIRACRCSSFLRPATRRGS